MSNYTAKFNGRTALYSDEYMRPIPIIKGESAKSLIAELQRQNLVIKNALTKLFRSK